MTATILLVEDDATTANLLRRAMSAVADIHSVEDVESGLAAVTAHGWDGLVVDLALPDGSGFEVRDAFRVGNRVAPALVCTASREAEDINRAQSARAYFAAKPVAPVQLRIFAEDVVAERARRKPGVREALAEYARERSLSRQQIRVLEVHLVEGRKAIARRLGIAEETVKTHVERLLRKCDDAECLEDVAREVRARVGAFR